MFRRKRNRAYYERKILTTTDYDTINELLYEAANQPEDVLSRRDFTKIYWLAQALLRREPA